MECVTMFIALITHSNCHFLSKMFAFGKSSENKTHFMLTFSENSQMYQSPMYLKDTDSFGSRYSRISLIPSKSVSFIMNRLTNSDIYRGFDDKEKERTDYPLCTV